MCFGKRYVAAKKTFLERAAFRLTLSLTFSIGKVEGLAFAQDQLRLDPALEPKKFELEARAEPPTAALRLGQSLNPPLPASPSLSQGLPNSVPGPDSGPQDKHPARDMASYSDDLICGCCKLEA